jgi:hypothetical protein
LEFVNQTIRKSPAIQRRVGDVQEVRLGILESYKENGTELSHGDIYAYS